jgi:DNA-binding HxlR family transcriptional regulator
MREGIEEQQAAGPYNCPVEAALAVLGGKWKIILLWHLAERTHRFGELRRLVPNITEKMLAQQLRELEHDGLIDRTLYAEVPPRVEYTLTAYGRTALPVVDALCQWGEQHEVRGARHAPRDERPA